MAGEQRFPRAPAAAGLQSACRGRGGGSTQRLAYLTCDIGSLPVERVTLRAPGAPPPPLLRTGTTTLSGQSR